jgi:uncharacterized protein (TIGR03085 family)
MAGSDLAQQERRALCDLFEELGPDAPTLCAGWTTADLAAHLVARERRPDSGPGLVWPPLAAHTEKVRSSLRERTPWAALIARVRSGPPMLLRPFDGPMNTVEFFIHVEDVRRARPNWAARSISDGMANALWARVGAGGMAKKVAATIELRSEGRAPKANGTGPLVVIEGDPGEHTMFGSGRQSASLVTLEGDAAIVEQLRTARLGI